jgi:hypothetical protein
MSPNKFINRSDELRYLHDRYHSPISELIVIYGRRRVGKTELLNRFIDGKPGLYLLATTEHESQNITLFSREMALFLDDPQYSEISYPSFESLFTSFTSHHTFRDRSQSDKIILIIDEFPYLIEKNRDIPSIFQRIWDLYLSKLPIMLILSGSSISIMEQEVMGYHSPLFGRRTGQWQVDPLSFSHLTEFLPYNNADLARVWFVAGGVPAYLNLFDPKIDFWENVVRLFFEKGSYLYIEAELLLQYEFREAGNYLTILKAIAQGNTTMGEIINSIGLDRSMVSKYLSILIRLHMVREELPVTSSPNARKRHYRITDQYLSFWFRFIYPERTAIESRQGKNAWDRLENDFSRYCGQRFEDLTEHLIREQLLLSDIPLGTFGRWWHKETEIDLVGLHEGTNTLLCVECKWSDLSEQEALMILRDLKVKSKQILWRNDTRTDIFALMGRTIQGKRALCDQGYRVYDLDDLPLSKGGCHDHPGLYT